MNEQKKPDVKKLGIIDESPVSDDKQLEITNKTPEPNDKKNEAHTSDDKKLAVEIFKSFRDRAWASFDERRRHEYHMSLMFWAIYVATIGFVLKETLPHGLKLALTGGTLVLAGLYLYWNYNLFKRQQFDLKKATYFETLLLEKCGTETSTDFEKQFDIAKFRQPPKTKLAYLGNWNHVSEFVMTLVLAAASIAVIWLK